MCDRNNLKKKNSAYLYYSLYVYIIIGEKKKKFQ